MRGTIRQNRLIPGGFCESGNLRDRFTLPCGAVYELKHMNLLLLFNGGNMKKREIDAIVNTLLTELEVGTESKVIKNRFGGESIKCPPDAVALYDFFMGMECLSGGPLEQILAG